VLLSVGALALCFAPGALAQSDTQVALAEALYQQGRLLVAEGKYDEACPKFAESHRLEPATGTLLNLAACHEAQGKLATAWIQFSDAFVASRRDRRDDRMKFAQEHMAALEPKLSRLTLVVAPEADEPGLELTLDGAVVGPAVRGVATLIDPGRHVVEAKAPGKKDWREEVEIGASAGNRTVKVPKLEPLAASPAPFAPAPQALAPLPAPAPPRDEVERPIPTSVYVAGGVTLALGVASGVTGAVYLDRKASYDRARLNDPDAARSDHDSVETIGIVNLGLWIATAAGAGATGYFYFSRPERAASRTARVVPWLTREGGGLTTSGEF
jgi:tetratricopeptide (TPR) repeat protein